MSTEDENATGTEPLEVEADEPAALRKRLEHVLREVMRRGLEKGIEAGIGTMHQADKLRDLVGDVKLPREVVGYLFAQVDETKNALVLVVAREVREFLEATDVAAELRRALTTLSFEIRTEIRFVPNDQGDGVKPDITSKVTPKRAAAGKAAATSGHDDD